MTETNPNLRLETFSDGVFAIALTLLVIDIKIPANFEINSSGDFWLALKHIAPSVFTFIISFFIILITWVNHHNCLKLVHKSSASFIYANGFLLLAVVFLPFPTSLLGEHIMTNHPAPAIILYNGTIVIQSIGWILLSSAALNNNLCKSEKAIKIMRTNRQNGYYSFIVYSSLAILAIWIPITIVVLTVLLWIFWLIYGISIKHD